jgi:acyl-CoA thioester hydrolase
VAVNEFLRALGFQDQLVSGDLDFQLVKQTTEWRAPAQFDQVLAVSVSATRVGTTSFTFTTEFRVAGSEGLIATVETVYVLVEADTLKKRPIPDDVRAAFERGAPDIVTDHAGYRQ